MTALPAGDDVCVIQRNPRTGCIPAGIEWMLKSKGVEGIDYSDFQERFDLQSQGREGNSFSSVSRAVSRAYPQLKFEDKHFPTGMEKLMFVERLVSTNNSCLISIALAPHGGWHCVPVIKIDGGTVTVLWRMDKPIIQEQRHDFKRSDLETRHDNWSGGKEVLFFSDCNS